MNMFRDIAMVALIGLGVAFLLTDATEWPLAWMGNYLASFASPALDFLNAIKPFTSIFCYALALALFMTRIKF